MNDMQIIADNYKTIDKTIDNAIKSMRLVMPHCLTIDDLKAQAFYQICKKIHQYDAAKGVIDQFCFQVAKRAIINFLTKISVGTYRTSRSIAISGDINLSKTKELNHDRYCDDSYGECDIIEKLITENLFKTVIARLKSRERFLAIMIYRQGWNTQDIMQHYKVDGHRAKNQRSYMQRRFRQELSLIQKTDFKALQATISI